jgi:hypothetical protein
VREKEITSCSLALRSISIGVSSASSEYKLLDLKISFETLDLRDYIIL